MKLSTTCTLTFYLLFMGCIAFSQSSRESNRYFKTEIGVSMQGYPAGMIITVNLEHYITEDSAFLFRVGSNFVDRKDFSDQNNSEKGYGFGGTLGYRKYYPLRKGQLFAGFNTDIWNTWIDWRDGIKTPFEASGTTYTFVLQPWLEAGYFFTFNNTTSSIGLSAGFGREINLITKGETVAQDWIASLTFHYKFQL